MSINLKENDRRPSDLAAGGATAPAPTWRAPCRIEGHDHHRLDPRFRRRDRPELKEIDPPQDVQETMNKVVKAENEKVAAVDFATATETMADGARRAEIKRAEGIKQAKTDRYFTGNAQLLRRLITVERSLQSNSKIVVPAGSELVNVIGDIAGVLPLPRAQLEPHRAARATATT